VTRLVIGIPTRNRPELAMGTIDSVLDGGVTDVSVVVSDNSTDPDARDRLREYCSSLANSALVYTQPPELLAMAAHWEWLRRFIHERLAPSHLGYLTDRLVLLPGALERLVDVIAGAPRMVLSYQVDHVMDFRTPVELVQRQWTGDLLELSSRGLIEMARRGRYGDYVPRMMNSIAPAAVLERIERRFGDVFGSVSPDYRFAFRCLAECDSTLYLDRSCAIERGMRQSSGISFLRGHVNVAASRFAQELSVARFGATPEPGFETVANAIFQEYCSVRAEAGAGFPPLHPRSYLWANAASVDRIEDPEWRARMTALLRRRGWTRRASVGRAVGTTLEMAGYFLRHPGAIGRTVKRQLWDRPPGTPAAFLLPRVGLNPAIRDDLRFATAAEAVAHAGTHPRTRTPYAWHVHQLARGRAIVRRCAQSNS
jgi:hypothetical protein